MADGPMDRGSGRGWPARVGLAAFALAWLVPALAAAGEGAAGGGRAFPRPSELLFWAIAALTLVSGAGVAFSRNIVYSAFSLLGTFMGVAGLYVFLSADFLAVTQVLIYVGGVLVLILFAVMLTSRIQDVRVSNTKVGAVQGAVVGVLMAALLTWVAVDAPWRVAGTPVYRETAARLGDLFLGRYLLPFEIASVVLLATLVGAVVIARKEIKPG